MEYGSWIRDMDTVQNLTNVQTRFSSARTRRSPLLTALASCTTPRASTVPSLSASPGPVRPFPALTLKSLAPRATKCSWTKRTASCPLARLYRTAQSSATRSTSASRPTCLSRAAVVPRPSTCQTLPTWSMATASRTLNTSLKVPTCFSRNRRVSSWKERASCCSRTRRPTRAA